LARRGEARQGLAFPFLHGHRKRCGGKF